MIVRPKHPKQLIAMLNAHPLILYGMGGAGMQIARWCDQNAVPYVFADQNAVNKQQITDKDVILPETLRVDYPDANVVICSILYYDEIAQKLFDLGVKEEHILSYRLFMPEQVTWKDLEYATVWGKHIGRMKAIADWIPANATSVADYGEGKSTLKQFLSPQVVYYPIDYVMRSANTILCDFNIDDFPPIKTDVAICTSTLVFITTALELLEHISINTAQAIILSYVTTDIFANRDGRRTSGYVNDFTQAELIQLLGKHGFALRKSQPDPANRIDTLYFFSRV